MQHPSSFQTFLPRLFLSANTLISTEASYSSEPSAQYFPLIGSPYTANAPSLLYLPNFHSLLNIQPKATFYVKLYLTSYVHSMITGCDNRAHVTAAAGVGGGKSPIM